MARLCRPSRQAKADAAGERTSSRAGSDNAGPSVEVHVSSEGTQISGVVQKNSAGEAVVGATVLELAKTAVLAAVAVVTAVLVWNFPGRLYGLQEVLLAAVAVGIAVATGLPAIAGIRRYFKD